MALNAGSEFGARVINLDSVEMDLNMQNADGN